MKNREKNVWYNNANSIINLIILVILLIIISSQSFANNNFSLELLGSIINHNSIYLFVLIYFVLLKFNFGKKYFNYLGLLLIFLYGLTSITSFLTLIQNFSINTVLVFITNFALFIYLFHTMLRGTVFWREFNLKNSPFNEISNDGLFYIIVVLSVFLLIVNLIGTAVLRGVVLSILDAGFLILFGRYIFLYRKYLDTKKVDVNNPGNFDDIKDKVEEKVVDVQDKVQEVLDKTDIDEKIIDTKNKVVKNTKTKVKSVLDKTDIDEKIIDVKNKVVEKTDKKPKKSGTKKTVTKKKGENK